MSSKVALAMPVALAAVMAFEGFRQSAYLDPVGIPTICYGETAGVRMGQTRTEAECADLLAGRLGDSLAMLEADLPDAHPRTLAALASFVYNVGENAYRGSTLRRYARAGDMMAACGQLDRWVYAGGKKLRGLVIRREKERQLCEAGVLEVSK